MRLGHDGVYVYLRNRAQDGQYRCIYVGGCSWQGAESVEVQTAGLSPGSGSETTVFLPMFDGLTITPGDILVLETGQHESASGSPATRKTATEIKRGAVAITASRIAVRSFGSARMRHLEVSGR